MIGTVVEVSLETYYGITRERSLEDSVSEALFNCGEEALGNCAADYALGELERIAVAG